MNILSNQLSAEEQLVQTDCCPIFIKYFEGYKCREIAESMNLPLQVVKDRIKTNQRKLRANLKQFSKRFKDACTA
ncbi:MULTISPECIES: hypothetical protein [Pedobacter]|uniref:hypothetical protein n=1 Tax=Pedobacter TaxID=84567 RepID=UPI00210960EC|nr:MULTISPECIES: hypothetical protein [unclassified Pedobacter]